MDKPRTLIHFVRHGEVHNPKHVRYGRLPGFHLSENGRLQVEQAAHFFLRRKVTTIYSSPLERTQQTATLLGLAFPYAPIHLDARLLEIKTAALFEGQSRDRHFYYPDHDTPDAETPETIYRRLTHFCEDKIAAHHGQEIIVVTHGDPIAIFLNSYLTGQIDPNYTPYPSYASVHTCVYSGLTLTAVWRQSITSAGGVRG